jgi:hypothetical protein
MGPYRGGQAEYLRVPFADFNCLQLPEDSVDKENDYVMLADIFPDRLAWHPAGEGAAGGQRCRMGRVPSASWPRTRPRFKVRQRSSSSTTLLSASRWREVRRDRDQLVQG